MIKKEIESSVLGKMGMPNDVDSSSLLTGQRITRTELMNLPAFKLMNPEERKIFDSILDSMNSVKNGTMEESKVLVKKSNDIIPYMPSEENNIVAEFKDAA